MPVRSTPLITDQIYHVYNRGIDHRITFHTKRHYQRLFATISYYRFTSLPMRLSYFLDLHQDRKVHIQQQLTRNPTQIKFLAYCFMPNHFHFLLLQKVDGGISKFLSNVQNSYTRYYNTKHKRIGPLFLNQFKAVRIEEGDQLLHVARYIHLNPYTSYVVKSIDELFEYRWSSIGEYLTGNPNLCDIGPVMQHFKNNNAYKTFLSDQAGYQRRLDGIKHLVSEEIS